MRAVDIIVLALISIWFIIAAVYVIIMKKRGKCIGCGGDCSKCNKNNK